jgi:hypothetical protein
MKAAWAREENKVLCNRAVKAIRRRVDVSSALTVLNDETFSLSWIGYFMTLLPSVAPDAGQRKRRETCDYYAQDGRKLAHGGTVCSEEVSGGLNAQSG